MKIKPAGRSIRAAHLVYKCRRQTYAGHAAQICRTTRRAVNSGRVPAAYVRDNIILNIAPDGILPRQVVSARHTNMGDEIVSNRTMNKPVNASLMHCRNVK